MRVKNFKAPLFFALKRLLIGLHLLLQCRLIERLLALIVYRIPPCWSSRVEA